MTAIAFVRRLVRLTADLLVGVPAILVLAPLWLLPWRTAAALGRVYGYLVFCAYGIGRRTGQINLRRAYGVTLSRAAARRATLEVFGHMGQAIAEGLHFGRRYAAGAGDCRHLIEMEDEAANLRLLADPRPKIFVTAHLGSWEVAVAFAARMAGGGAVVLRRIDNRILDFVFQRIRVPAGLHFIDKRGGGAGALTALREGRHVAMLADENAGPRGAFVPFLGRDASTLRTPALLACQTGAPIVIGAAIRRRRLPLLYKVAVLEPPAGGTPADVHALTRAMAAVMDEWIRTDPRQWRWIHWRWKTRPDGSEERYRRADVDAAFAAADAPVVGALGELL